MNNQLIFILLLIVLAHSQDCLPGTFRNTSGDCSDCINIDGEGCGVYPCQNYIFNGSLCLDCNKIPNVDINNGSTTIGLCNCYSTYFWVGGSLQCLSCQNVTESLTCYYQCQGFFFNNQSNVCKLCQSIQFIDRGSPWNYGSIENGCTCQPGYAWQNFTCITCYNLTLQQSCKQSTCSGWVWIILNETTSICGDCLSINNSDISQQYLIEGGCKCNDGFVWETQFNYCIECRQASTEIYCGHANCRDKVVWSGGNCTICSDIANANVQYGILPLGGVCFCDILFAWYPINNTCATCELADSNYCGMLTCINFIFVQSKCKSCAKIANTKAKVALSNPSTFTACDCLSGYIWSFTRLTCTQCDITKAGALYMTTNMCVNCSTIKNGLSNLSSLSAYTKTYFCLCAANYIFIDGTCGCNNTIGKFDIGKSAGCVQCKLMPGGVNFNTTTLVCNCISTAVWNAVLKSCQCKIKSQYLTLKGCVNCSSLGGGVTLNAASVINPLQCVCSSGLVWNQTFATCGCIKVDQIWSDFKCVSCNLAKFYSNGTRQGVSSCFCFVNQVWSATTKTCKCIANSAEITALKCKLCSTIPGSTGLSTTSKICGCKTNWKWNTTFFQCTCLTDTCICGAGYVLFNKRCISCSSITGSTSNNVNNTFCECSQSFIWSVTTAKCSCPLTAITNIAGTLCYYCNVYNNAITKNITGKCTCMTNYIWSTSSLRCIFATTTKTIMQFNGTKISCLNLGGSTGVPLDNFNCKCQVGSIWRDYSNQCIKCSTIVNATGVANGLSCSCSDSYNWDILLFKCVPSNCTFPVSSPLCPYCIGIPGIIDNTNTFEMTASPLSSVVFSGEVDFAGMMGNSSSVYKNYVFWKCKCSAGYAWNMARRRCFNKLVNATY